MPKGIYDRGLANTKPPQNKKFHKTSEWLENEYLVNQKSTTEIGLSLGMSAVAINRWLKKYNIPIRNKYDPICRKRMSETAILVHTKYHITKDELRREFVENRKTINNLSIMYGCSWDAIRRRLIKYGFTLNKKSGVDSIVNRRRSPVEYRTFNKRIVNLYEYKCAICGYNKFVVAHHLKKWSETIDNSEKNGICLCPNHHAEADYGIIKIEELQTYQINKRKSDTPSNGRLTQTQ